MTTIAKRTRRAQSGPTAALVRMHRHLMGRLEGRNDRGDVPGWVLITLMTAGLVTVLWALAGDQLETLFTDAISGVTGPGAP